MNNRYVLIFKTTVFFLLTGVLMTHRLWLTERNFPLLPLFDFTVVSAFAGNVLFALLLLFLISCLIKYKRILALTLFILLFFMAIQDQARWQPWTYHYFVFLIPFCFKKKKDSLVYFQLVLVGIYFWGGLNKLNPFFVNHVFPFFMHGLTGHEINMFKEAGYMVPLAELAIAMGLLFKKFQKAAVLLAFLTHILIILVVSPLGSNINYIIIPWNLAMMAYLYLCFLKSPGTVSIVNFWKHSSYKLKPILVFLVITLPVLGFFNKWDYYLSFNLYSGKGSVYQIMISKDQLNKLPYNFENALMPGSAPEGSSIIDLYTWSVNELNVPLPPQKRLFSKIANEFCKAGIPDEDLIYMELKRPIPTGTIVSYTCDDIK